MSKLSITGFYKAAIKIFGIQMKDEGSMALNFCEFYQIFFKFIQFN